MGSLGKTSGLACPKCKCRSIEHLPLLTRKTVLPEEDWVHQVAGGDVGVGRLIVAQDRVVVPGVQPVGLEFRHPVVALPLGRARLEHVLGEMRDNLGVWAPNQQVVGILSRLSTTDPRARCFAKFAEK